MIGQYESRFGPLLYEVNDKSISRVWWGASDTNSAKTNEIMSKFWDDWFDDPTTPCPLLLHQCGTPFQEKVWSRSAFFAESCFYRVLVRFLIDF